MSAMRGSRPPPPSSRSQLGASSRSSGGYRAPSSASREQVDPKRRTGE
jgi:hypothetical protein